MVTSSVPVLVGDLVRFPQWKLLGHPFAHTYTHNDSAGFCTYVTVIEGKKLWFMLEWTKSLITPEMWHHRWKHLSLQEMLVLEYSKTPPWVKGSGPDMEIDHSLHKAHQEEWESYRVAEWVCIYLTPGMTL